MRELLEENLPDFRPQAVCAVRQNFEGAMPTAPDHRSLHIHPQRPGVASNIRQPLLHHLVETTGRDEGRRQPDLGPENFAIREAVRQERQRLEEDVRHCVSEAERIQASHRHLGRDPQEVLHP